MDLDGLFDDGGAGAPERRGWLAVRILLLTLVATALGGVLLAGVLYVVGVGVLTAWLKSGGGIG